MNLVKDKNNKAYEDYYSPEQKQDDQGKSVVSAEKAEKNVTLVYFWEFDNENYKGDDKKSADQKRADFIVEKMHNFKKSQKSHSLWLRKV